MDNKIAIEVVYARTAKQLLLDLEVDEGTTIEQAVLQSGIIDQFPEINLDKDKVGIFGKLSKKAYILRAGDRIEIYRPLIADPKEVRKQRAAEGKKMKKGGGV